MKNLDQQQILHKYKKYKHLYLAKGGESAYKKYKIYKCLYRGGAVSRGKPYVVDLTPIQQNIISNYFKSFVEAKEEFQKNQTTIKKLSETYWGKEIYKPYGIDANYQILSEVSDNGLTRFRDTMEEIKKYGGDDREKLKKAAKIAFEALTNIDGCKYSTDSPCEPPVWNDDGNIEKPVEEGVRDSWFSENWPENPKNNAIVAALKAHFDKKKRAMMTLKKNLPGVLKRLRRPKRSKRKQNSQDFSDLLQSTDHNCDDLAEMIQQIRQKQQEKNCLIEALGEPDNEQPDSPGRLSPLNTPMGYGTDSGTDSGADSGAYSGADSGTDNNNQQDKQHRQEPIVQEVLPTPLPTVEDNTKTIDVPEDYCDYSSSEEGELFNTPVQVIRKDPDGLETLLFNGQRFEQSQVGPDIFPSFSERLSHCPSGENVPCYKTKIDNNLRRKIQQFRKKNEPKKITRSQVVEDTWRYRNIEFVLDKKQDILDLRKLITQKNVSVFQDSSKFPDIKAGDRFVKINIVNQEDIKKLPESPELPKVPSIYYAIKGQQFFEQGNIRLQEGVGDDVSNPEAAKEFYERSKVAYLQALQLEPDNTDLKKGLGKVYEKMGDITEEAQQKKDYYQESLDLGIDNWNVNNGLGYALERLGDINNHTPTKKAYYEQAKTHYEQAKKFDKDNSTTNAGIQRILQKQKQLDELIKVGGSASAHSSVQDDTITSISLTTTFKNNNLPELSSKLDKVIKKKGFSFFFRRDALITALNNTPPHKQESIKYYVQHGFAKHEIGMILNISGEALDKIFKRVYQREINTMRQEVEVAADLLENSHQLKDTKDTKDISSLRKDFLRKLSAFLDKKNLSDTTTISINQFLHILSINKKYRKYFEDEYLTPEDRVKKQKAIDNADALFNEKQVEENSKPKIILKCPSRKDVVS